METPILALIPSGYKAEKVYSVLPSDGSGDFTFDRANGLATRVNKDGLIEEVANDTPRLDYLNSTCPNLLLESESTNLQVYSQEFQRTEWSKVGIAVTADNTTSPSGELNADKVQRSTNSSGVSYINGVLTKSASQIQYTTSVFVKQGEGDYFALRVQGNYADRIDIRFQFSTKSIIYTNAASGNAVLNSTSVIEYANGWFRISYSYLSDTRNLLANYFSGRASSGNVDGGDTSSTAFVYLWGCQAEQSTSVSSYIPTTTIQTRFKDICKEGGNSTLFDITEGTFFVDLFNFDSVNSSVIGLSNGTDAQKITFLFEPSLTRVRTFSSGGVLYYDTLNYNQRNKILVTFKLNEYKTYINGVLVSTDTAATVPAGMDRLNFSHITATTLFFEGEVHDTRVYDRVLTEAEAIKLTT